MSSTKMNGLIRGLYHNNLVISLNDIFSHFDNKTDYDTFCEYIDNFILDDYSRAGNIVTIIDEWGKEHKINLFQLLINLYFLEFNFLYKIPVTSKWLIDVDKEFLKNFHSEIEKMCEERISPIINKKKLDAEKVFSWILSNLTERMITLTEMLAPIGAPTLNLFDISEFCDRDSEFNKLLDTELDDTKSFNTLERELVEDGKKLKKIILSDGKSCLVPFLESNCLNDQQLQQMFIAVGPRMSASNVVMNHIMKRSYLNGLQNVGDLIAESEIAAKALIYKKKFVSVSGYMSREGNLAGMNLSVDYDMDDCGTIHNLTYYVKSQKHLDLIVNKNRILPNGKLKIVTADDTDLIGTLIQLRSICCCAHKNRRKVCKACYGNPKSFNKRYKIGGAISTEIQNPLSNAVMAVKHHTGTQTKEFNDEELLKLFINDDSRLILRQLDNADKISIVFNKEYVEDIIDRLEHDVDINDDDDDEDDINGTSVVSKMLTEVSIVTKNYDEVTNEETETVYEVKLDGSFLTFANDMLNLQNAKKIKIPIDSDVAILNLSDLKPGTATFNVKYITAETSRYLNDLKKIIERAKAIWYDSIDDAIGDFADLIIESGLKNKELVYIEPIIHALTRDPNYIMNRPDFSKKEVPLVIVNLKTAIFKGDLVSALIYQELTKIFKDRDSFFRDRSIGDGIHDSSFKTSARHDFGYMKRALKKAKLI